MFLPMPTHVGDISILSTARSFTIYVVGRVSQDGQQGFDTQAKTTHLPDEAAARAQAKAIVKPRQKIFLRDIDTGKWSEISN